MILVHDTSAEVFIHGIYSFRVCQQSLTGDCSGVMEAQLVRQPCSTWSRICPALSYQTCLLHLPYVGTLLWQQKVKWVGFNVPLNTL